MPINQTGDVGGSGPTSSDPRLSAFLDLPKARACVFPLNVDAYDSLTEMGTLGKGVELVRGVLIKRMAKSPLHCKLIKQIFLYLLALQQKGLVVFSERPLRLTHSVPEPDVMIVRGKESDYDVKHPSTAELVVEVAASSAALDRESAALYAEAGVWNTGSC